MPVTNLERKLPTARARTRKGPSDELLAASYADHQSVHKVAAVFEINHDTVHRRLQKLGVMQPVNVFSDTETKRLAREYELFSSAGKLSVLAASMGRTRHFLCRKARDLGLTNKDRSRPWLATWKYLSDEAAEVVWEQFKASRLGLGQFCTLHKFDDLGFSRAMKERYADEWEAVIELKAPKQSMYRLGRAMEYRARDHLKSLGYFVMRSPASKSPIDLLAVKHGITLMVQCKRSGALPVKEWNELFDLARSCGSIPVMCMSGPGGRGCEYFVMLDRKDGTKRPQPMEAFKP